MNAEAFVRNFNHGLRSIPTLIFDDGSYLVEPTIKELELKFKINEG
jgi:hypothetical protein